MQNRGGYMTKYKEQISKYYSTHKEMIYKSLSEIVAIDSSFKPCDDPDKPFGEGSAAALAWAQSFARENGFKTRNFDNYAIDIDFDDKEPVLGILSHLDVVPAGEGWKSDPFRLKIRDGNIYGRGTIDDKGPSVAVLYAMKCIKELGIPLKKGFRVIMGGDEEQGCKDIEYYQTKQRFPENVFTPDGSFPVLNCEKGMLHLRFSAPFDGGIEIESPDVLNAIPAKCVVRTNGESVIFEGKNAHGSRPENGDNAVTKFLSGYSGDDKRLKALKELFPHGEYDGRSCGMGFKDDISGVMTCALTVLRTQGGRLSGGIDIRFPIDRTLEEISGIITSRLEAAGFEIDECEGMQPHYVDEKGEFVQTLLKVYESVLGQKGSCIAEGGVTYVHNTPGGVAFGAEFEWEQNNMHGADEHISEKTFEINFNMYANAIAEICG